MNNNKKLMFFMFFHNSYTCSDDHLSLIMKTGNAKRKERCHKLSFILVNKYKAGVGLKVLNIRTATYNFS